MCDRAGRDPLPSPPSPERFVDPDGRPHVLAYRLTHGATGINAELTEVGVEEGYAFRALAAPHADPQRALDHVRETARREIGTQYLKRSPFTGEMTIADREVRGRIIWRSPDEMAVVVDGRQMTWDELGRAIQNEGWNFTITVDEPIGMVDDYDPALVFGGD
ncbi:hypothetical protein GBF35_28555 [Nonomuraea phyllanthi]|uniref:DUF7713 domain-containing protein n=1 Tax=Nonomuraea phyllanthi TaxID=2219224 RepID=UPI001292EA41|nr:hypothetical protein [Nonomuraea phyllanthi]QFY10068.1 hypothetical protein GBF35_28555 [Nonomuraea phyllanthi]